MHVSIYCILCENLVSVETPKALLGRKAGIGGELHGKHKPKQT